MTQCRFYQQTGRDFSRRGLIKGVAAVAGVATIGTRFALAQSTQTAATPPSTVTNPPRDFGPGAPPVTYPDSDILTIDPLFNKYRVNNTAIVRLWTGGLWSEGPAWSNQGQYLVWSDIPNNRQLRWFRRMVTSASSGCRPTTAMATASTFKDASLPAST